MSFTNPVNVTKILSDAKSSATSKVASMANVGTLKSMVGNATSIGGITALAKSTSIDRLTSLARQPTLVKPTIFSSGADEKLAAVDIYKTITGSSTYTNVKSIINSNFDTKSLKGLVANPFGLAINMSATLAGLSKSKLSLSKADIIGRITSSSKEIGSVFKSANSTFQAVLTKGMSLQSMPKTMQVMIGSAIKNVSISNLNSLDGVAGSINKIAGLDVIQKKDSKSISAFIGTIVGTANDLGIDGAAGNIINALGNPKVKNLLATSIAKKLAGKTATKDLQSVVSSSSYGSVYSASSDIIYHYCKSYKGGKLKTNQELLSDYQTAFNTFNSIKTDWYLYTRRVDNSNDVCYNLEPLVCENQEFFSMLDTGAIADSDPVKKVFLAAKLLKRTDVKTALKSKYPKTVFKF